MEQEDILCPSTMILCKWETLDLRSIAKEQFASGGVMLRVPAISDLDKTGLDVDPEKSQDSWGYWA